VTGKRRHRTAASAIDDAGRVAYVERSRVSTENPAGFLERNCRWFADHAHTQRVLTDNDSATSLEPSLPPANRSGLRHSRRPYRPRPMASWAAHADPCCESGC